MTITLKPVTRDNWLEALALQVNQEQSGFVPTVAVSLAKVHIKPDGDEVEYLPFAIYNGETMVGFMMHAFVERTANMYWINGFLIDSKYQGKGYGKAALEQMIAYITNRFSQCEEIRLTVYPHNEIAYRLYQSVGFVETGERLGEELVLRRPNVSA
ncbi:GNAT family N-acetyltransferase [Brevibacillus composti]|uniref:GNAT family N-acetyltransferase n=1 Tax=Brevibacillus composti TaxID=2796470 RepID=A0A7T5JPA7_9BACL|nr:GNAT family N-acetyltransferase [Brevibacillus composti]QQE75059.1 GNAT family N-acetyltransferase [Brevibacillus composti]QUO42145.1 GNAT family N-acetyltransferase [Brevibacillus composti]